MAATMQQQSELGVSHLVFAKMAGSCSRSSLYSTVAFFCPVPIHKITRMQAVRAVLIAMRDATVDTLLLHSLPFSHTHYY